MNFGHFLSFIVTFPLVAGQSPIYALLGQKISFNPKTNVPPEGIHILWKQNGDKVVEFNGHEERVYGSYGDRVTLDWHSADLDIRDLRFEDSGEYELEIHRSKILHRSKFKLEVLEHVPTPTISCEINDNSRSDTSGPQATLTCSAKTTKSHPLTRVEWGSDGTPEPGPNFTIPLGLQHDEDVYRCTVKNPLSNQTATFTAKECYSETSRVVIPAVICVAVIAAIAAAVAVVFCKLKRKACFATDDKEDVEKQPPLLNPHGFEKEPADQEEWRNSLHNKATLPSNQRLRHLSQLDEHSDNCVNSTEEEIKFAIKETSNEKGDLGEHERLLHNRPTLPSSQRLGHIAHLNEEHDFVSNDEENETRKEKEEDNDLSSYSESNLSPDAARPDSPSTQNSVITTPNEEEDEQDEFAQTKTDYVDIIDRKSGESDSGLDEEKEPVILPSLSVIDKEEIMVEGPNDDYQQERDDELSEDESYNESLSTADQDDTGINQTLNTNNNILTEPVNTADTASDDEVVDTPDSKSSTTEADATEDGNEGPKEGTCEEEDDVIPKSPDEIGGESNSKDEEEEIKAGKLKEESPNPEDECDSTPAEEESAKLTEEDAHQQRVENLGHDAANAADNHSEPESRRKSSLSDTSSQPRSPTLSKQEDITSCSECFDVQADQESRHNSVSDQGPNKEEAFIDDKELQCGPEEQRPSKEGLCENKEAEKQTEEVE